MTEPLRSAAIAFMRQLHHQPVKTRLAELGFDDTAGDMIVVCPPGLPLRPEGDVPVGARRVLYVAAEDSEFGWSMVWADEQPS